MYELIRVNFSSDSDQPTVSARELHEFLGVKDHYRTWFPRMCEYGFEEGRDFRAFFRESSGGRPSQDAEITLDMAKELCMLQRNEKGKRARQYFLQLERDWNSPEKIMARALQIARKTIEQKQEIVNAQAAKIAADAPKVLFAESVAASHTSILVFDLAKILCQNGVKIGGARLFEWMREHGYLVKRKCSDWNMPTQKSMDMGLFEIKETVINHSDGHVTVNRTPKVTGKGQQFFVNRFLGGNRHAE
ncbi:MAG: phage antirepressor KilAC domain-containing protein [Butyricicoccus sp.]|nr:phage antirepressor KilAC domain-containing protein [Butyricicoccus sp.]